MERKNVSSETFEVNSEAAIVDLWSLENVENVENVCATVKCVKYKKIGGDFLEGSDNEESSNATIVSYKNETEQRLKVPVERHHGEEKNELEKII